MDFNTEEYWKDREHKVFIVSLGRRIRVGRKIKTEYDSKIVRARTAEGAIRTAKINSMFGDRCGVYMVRLATPTDLGVQPVNA